MRREVDTLGRLALPILLTQLAYMATAATDSIMAGRLEATALAAVGLAGAIWVPVATFIGGTLHILLPRIGGHVAARRAGAAGRDAVQGAWLGVAMGSLAALLLAFAAPAALDHLGIAETVVAPTRDYLAALAAGMPFFGLWTAARFFCDGHSDTRPAMLTAAGIALLNVPLNLLLMYDDLLGLGIGAGMGVAGIGLSTALSLATGAVAMTARAWFGRRYASARLPEAPRRPDWRAMRDLFVAGAPIGGGFLAEYAAMSVIAVFIGGISGAALAAHQVALNVSMTLFMLPMAVAMAVCIRVGMAVGAEDPAAARRTVGAGLMLGCGLALGAALGVLGFAEAVAALYTPDPAVRAVAANLLRLAAVFQMVNAVQAVLAGALRGRGEVRLPLAFILAGYWLLALPAGWWLAASGGASGWWTGIVLALVAVAAAMAVRAWMVVGAAGSGAGGASCRRTIPDA